MRADIKNWINVHHQPHSHAGKRTCVFRKSWNNQGHHAIDILRHMNRMPPGGSECLGCVARMPLPWSQGHLQMPGPWPTSPFPAAHLSCRPVRAVRGNHISAAKEPPQSRLCRAFLLAAWSPHTMSAAKVLAKCKLKYYKLSECLSTGEDAGQMWPC